GLPVPPAQQGEEHPEAADHEQAADEVGHHPRPHRPGGERDVDGAGVDQRVGAEGDDGDGEDDLADRPGAGCRRPPGGVGCRTHGQTRPMSARVCRTVSMSSRRKAAKSSPARKASSQLFASRAEPHDSVSWRSVTSWVSASACSSSMPPGATTPRQFVSTRSMPCSVRVGTSGSAGDRSALETASALRVPALTCSAYSPTPEMPASTLLPRSAASDSPPPE